MKRNVIGGTLILLMLFSSCSRSSSPTDPSPENWGKEEFLSLMRSAGKAMYESNAQDIAKYVHPETVAQGKAAAKFFGEDWPSKPGGDTAKTEFVPSIFPDLSKVQFQKQGDWARLYRQGEEGVGLALFHNLGGTWYYVMVSTNPNMTRIDELDPHVPETALAEFVFPPEESLIWLGPVELIVRPVRVGEKGKQADGLMFGVRNIGEQPLTQRQLLRFFSSISYRLNDQGRSQQALDKDTAPAQLAPGKSLVISNNVDIDTEKPGKLVVQWMVGKYLSGVMTMEKSR